MSRLSLYTGVRRPGNEATSDVLIIGSYATLVPHDGNIQGCEILKKYLFLKMWVFIHINLDRIMEYTCMSFHANQYNYLRTFAP